MKNIGTVSERIIKVEVCAHCFCQIEDSTGLCTYGCHLDGDLHRPKGMTIVRVYKRIDILTSETTK